MAPAALPIEAGEGYKVPYVSDQDDFKILDAFLVDWSGN